MDELFEPFNFGLVLSEQCVLGILVDVRLVLDVLGPVRVPKRGQCLVIIVVGRRDAGNLFSAVKLRVELIFKLPF